MYHSCRLRKLLLRSPQSTDTFMMLLWHLEELAYGELACGRVSMRESWHMGELA